MTRRLTKSSPRSVGKLQQCVVPLQKKIWDIRGSFDNKPQAILYLLQGDYRSTLENRFPNTKTKPFLRKVYAKGAGRKNLYIPEEAVQVCGLEAEYESCYPTQTSCRDMGGEVSRTVSKTLPRSKIQFEKPLATKILAPKEFLKHHATSLIRKTLEGLNPS